MNDSRVSERVRENYGLKEQEKNKIRSAINHAKGDPRGINKNIAQVLSELSENLVITNILELEEENFFKCGLAGLIELPEFREFDKIFRLTSFFEEFENFFREVEKEFFEDAELSIFIGRENPFAMAKDETLIAAKYRLPKNLTGSLSLIGPTRMDYKRNIGLVKYATKEINEAVGK